MAAKKKSSSSNAAAVGIGLTAAAVAAAGAYFLAGAPEAKNNRKKVKSWMLKAKADVLDVIEEAEQMTEGEYKQLVASATKTYGAVKKASKKDVAEFQKEMLAHWPAIVAEGKAVSDVVAKTVKNVKAKSAKAKKPAKKAASAKTKAKKETKTKPKVKKVSAAKSKKSTKTKTKK